MDQPRSLKAALLYLTYGWHPIPVHYGVNSTCSCYKGGYCPSPGKHPVPKTWQESAYTEAQLTAFWQENAHFNVGLVTGARSNLVVLDLDNRKGGQESLAALEDQYGSLPPTPTVLTGGGGRHFYFQYPKGLYIPTRGSILPGLDVRGDRGQAVAPPSYHNSGHFYKWAPGLDPGDIAVAPIPDWLRQKMEEREAEWISEDQSDQDTASTYYSGNRNNNLFRMGCRLRVIKDLTSEELLDILHLINKTKCVPPLDPGEVEQITKSVLKKGSKHVIIPEGQEGPAPRPVKVITIDSIWDENPENALPYLAPGLLLEGEIALLAAPTEAGKSLVAMSMAISIAAGLPVWHRGEPCAPRRVMYCTEELAGRTIRMRVRKLADGVGANRDLLRQNLLILPQQNLTLGLKNHENLDSFFLQADTFKPDLVILDTYISYYGGEEKSSEDNRAWFNAVPVALRARYGCAVIVQHHAKKPQQEDGKKVHYSSMSDIDLVHNIRGTSDLPGVCERVWFMWKKDESRGDFGPRLDITLRNVKAREGDKHEPFALIVTDPSEWLTTISAKAIGKGKKYREVEATLHKVLPVDVFKSKSDLADLLQSESLSRTGAYRWVETFFKDGILLRDPKDLYYLNPLILVPDESPNSSHFKSGTGGTKGKK